MKKRVLSLLLALAMVASLLAIPAFAEGGTEETDAKNIVLKIYDKDEKEIETGSIQVGDTIIAKVVVEKPFEVNNLDFFIRYDKEVLECNETAFYNEKGKYKWPGGTISEEEVDLKQFYHILSSERDDNELKIGQSAWRFLLTVDGAPISFKAGDVLCEMSYTAKKDTAETKLELLPNTVQYLLKEDDGSWGIDPVDMEDFTVQSLSLEVTDPSPVESITLNKTEITVAKGTTSRLLKATVNPVEKAGAVTWSSDHEEIAAVDAATGEVTGVSCGEATITARAGSKTATCKVTVNIPADSVIVTPASSKTEPITLLMKGDTVQLNGTVTPADTTDSIQWSSLDTDVVTVNDTGLVTAVGAGGAMVQAKAGNRSAYTYFKVVDLGTGQYTAAMPEGGNVVPGTTVTLPVVIGANDESVTNYNAFDLQFAYDPEALELTTTAVPGCTLETGDGTIRVIRYGKTQELGKAFDLEFQVKNKPGDTNVTLTFAQVDVSENALEKNAPTATITSAATKLHVVVNHAVTLPDTLEGNAYAEDGVDYTFSVKDYDPNYNYTVTATMGGADVEVKDNGDGTYTIENVTGDLNISMTKAGKNYAVLINGAGALDVSENAEVATYGTDYTFKLTKKDGYQYDITVKIGENAGAVTGPDADGIYRIAGDSIKGAVTITIDRTALPGTGYDVTVDGTGAEDVQAPERAVEGQDFTFTVAKKAGYAYEVSIAVNGSIYTRATVVTSEDGMTDTYTIRAAAITGPVSITVTKDKAYGVSFEYTERNTGYALIDKIFTGKLCKADGKTKIANNADVVKQGSDYTFVIPSFYKVYELKMEVTENGVVKSQDDVEMVIANSGATASKYTITVRNVKGDLNIKLSWLAGSDMMKIAVSPYLELDNKTIYLVATRTSAAAGKASGLKLDTFDGYGMYQMQNGLYADQIEGSAAADVKSAFTCLWLVEVNKGETFTVEDARQRLAYTNRLNMPAPTETIQPDNSDINGSGYTDVNDAQLVYDIYAGVHQSFCMTNKLKGAFVEVQTPATMTKLLAADMNRDMRVDLKDAAAVVDAFK